MHTNEFDKLVRDQFDQHEFDYKPSSWDRVASGLPAAASRRIPQVRITAIAASLALLVSALGWMYFHNDTQPSIATVATPATPAREKQELPVSKNTTADVSGAVPEVRDAYAPAKTPPGTAPTKIYPATVAPFSGDHPSVPENAASLAAVPEKDQLHGPAAADIAEVPSAVPVKPIAKNKIFEKEFFPEPPAKQPGRTNIGIAGGLNYGSLNTGYMAGINARQKLGNRLYLEGDLSLVSNQVSQANLTPEQFTAFQAGTANKPEQLNPGTANFLYLQFNPSIGYQVHKKLSLSLGADLQRLLDKDVTERRLIFVSDEAKQIPDLDLGITGRTEYAVSGRLKAGFLYREGINSLVQGNNKYLERSYMQLQLKYIVFGR